MKKQLIAASFAVSVAMAGHAAENTGPGCGLGTMLFKDQSGTGPYVLAATTNGSFGNQTFGMSTGTLGCDTSPTLTSNASVFIDENMEKVARDMSRGSGEHIETLAMLMNIEATDRVVFKQALQANFNDIYTHDGISSSEVINNMTMVMGQQEALNKYLG